MVCFYIVFPTLHLYTHYFIEIPNIDYSDAFINLNIINTIGIFISLIAYISCKFNPTSHKHSNGINFASLRNYSCLFILLGIILIFSSIRSGLDNLLLSVESQSPKSIYKYMLIENIPLLVGWAYIANYQKKSVKPSKFSFAFIFLIICFLSLLLSGTRGSRVSILIQISSFLILYSVFFKKIKFKLLITIFLFAFIFNFYFSIYKYSGIEGLENYIIYGDRTSFVEKNNSWQSVILHDLGRSDIQAIVYNSYLNGNFNPNYYPDSYINALTMIVPKFIYDFDKVSFSKNELGYSAQYGTEPMKGYSSTRIYGFAAESFMNFSWIGLLIYSISFGIVLRFVISLANNKSVLINLFSPFLYLVPVFLLFYDFANFIFMLIKVWSIPVIIFTLSRKRKRNV